MAKGKFSKPTIRALAQRVSYLCSNPNCRAQTIGPDQATPDKSVSLGQAAHVKGRTQSSARYDPDMSDAQRAHIDNGIWLCSNCHTRIDKDESFTVDQLNSWKKLAESHSSISLGKTDPSRGLQNDICQAMEARVQSLESLDSRFIVDWRMGERGEQNFTFKTTSDFSGELHVPVDQARRYLNAASEARPVEIKNAKITGSRLLEHLTGQGGILKRSPRGKEQLVQFTHQSLDQPVVRKAQVYLSEKTFRVEVKENWGGTFELLYPKGKFTVDVAFSGLYEKHTLDHQELLALYRLLVCFRIGGVSFKAFFDNKWRHLFELGAIDYIDDVIFNLKVFSRYIELANASGLPLNFPNMKVSAAEIEDVTLAADLLCRKSHTRPVGNTVSAVIETSNPEMFIEKLDSNEGSLRVEFSQSLHAIEVQGHEIPLPAHKMIVPDLELLEPKSRDELYESINNDHKAHVKLRGSRLIFECL